MASENKPSGAIEVTVARDFAALESRIEEWNRLVERAQTNTVFQTYECHASWWKVFGADRRLLILLAEADGELIGLAPSMASERSFLGRTQRMVEFIGAQSFDYCDFIIDRTRPDVFPLFLSELANGEDAFDQLYLRGIPDSSTTVGELRRFFESSGFLTEESCMRRRRISSTIRPRTSSFPTRKASKGITTTSGARASWNSGIARTPKRCCVTWTVSSSSTSGAVR